MLVGDARDAFDQLAVDACAELDRSSVRPHEDLVAARDSERLGVARRTARRRDRAAGTRARARARRQGRRTAADSAEVSWLLPPRPAEPAWSPVRARRTPAVLEGVRAVRCPHGSGRGRGARTARRRRPWRAVGCRRRSAPRASRSRPARRGTEGERRGGGAARGLRDSSRCRHARARRSPGGSGRPSRPRARGTSSGRSRASPSRRARARLGSPPPRRPRRAGARSARDSSRRRPRRPPNRARRHADSTRPEMEGAASRLRFELEIVRELCDPGPAASAGARPDEDHALRGGEPLRERTASGRQLRQTSAAEPGATFSVPAGEKMTISAHASALL